MEGKWVCEGAGPPGDLGESTSRKYLRDIVSGLMYLHAHVREKDFSLFTQSIIIFVTMSYGAKLVQAISVILSLCQTSLSL